MQWDNDVRTSVVASAFNEGIDELAEKLGSRPKLLSTPDNQSKVLDNLASAYDYSSDRFANVPIVPHVPKREARNYITQGEVGAAYEYENAYEPKLHFLNETGVKQEFLKRVARANRSDEGGFGVVVMDIKNFKYLNDALGQDVGDDILLATANTMRENSRDVDSFWRMGGDELAILLDAKSLKQLEHFIFEHRHASSSGEELPGWLGKMNADITSKLSEMVSDTKLAGSDLGDAGQLRAGVLFFDRNEIQKLMENEDGEGIASKLIHLANNKLSEVKEIDKSTNMVWDK